MFLPAHVHHDAFANLVPRPSGNETINDTMLCVQTHISSNESFEPKLNTSSDSGLQQSPSADSGIAFGSIIDNLLHAVLRTAGASSMRYGYATRRLSSFRFRFLVFG